MRYGGKTLVGADMPVLHVPAGQGGEGTGREVRPRLPTRRARPVWLRRSLLDKIGRSDSCRSAKGGAGVLCGGDAMRSGVVISVLMGEKTVLARGFAVQFIAVKRNVARRFLSQNKYGMGILCCGTG